MIKIYTIGFTKKSAETFFSFFKSIDIKTLIDVRLNNASQLAGYTKKNDLKYFLKKLCNVEYVHLPELAPTKEILNDYKKGNITWSEYEKLYFALLSEREVEKKIDISLLDKGCLLCSEHEPEYCHRRLAVEYLIRNTDLKIKVKHLK